VNLPTLGDANFDDEFNPSDLVLSAGDYEDETIGNSSWKTGDWNGDHGFTSSDLVSTLAGGGYEQGPRAAVQPEPTTGLMLTLGLLGVSVFAEGVSRIGCAVVYAEPVEGRSSPQDSPHPIGPTTRLDWNIVGAKYVARELQFVNRCSATTVFLPRRINGRCTNRVAELQLRAERKARKRINRHRDSLRQ
jgi:hypothetical protein